MKMKVRAMTRTLGDITSELKEKFIMPAKEEAKGIIDEARAQASQILREARQEAEEIRSKSIEDSDEAKKKMDADMQVAARHFVLLLEERLERSIVRPVAEETLRTVFDDPDFLKEIIGTLVQEFCRSQGSQSSIDIILPESKKSVLELFFLEKFKEKAAKGVTIRFSDKVSFAFRIGIGESGGKYFNFEDGLPQAFAEFCSPGFRKFFFGSSWG